MKKVLLCFVALFVVLGVGCSDSGLLDQQSSVQSYKPDDIQGMKFVAPAISGSSRAAGGVVTTVTVANDFHSSSFVLQPGETSKSIVLDSMLYDVTVSMVDSTSNTLLYKGVQKVFVSSNACSLLKIDRSLKTRAVDVLAIDLRDEIANRGIGVRDQNPRSTCSVFATTFLIEYWYSTFFGAGYADLSEEYLNHMANKIKNEKVDGEFFHYLVDAYYQYGVATEAVLPYCHDSYHYDLINTFIKSSMISTSQSMKETAVNSYALSHEFIKPLDYNGRVTLNDYEFNRVLAYLAQGIPVAMGRNHSVALVGFIKDANKAGGGEFIYKNSWGAGWGDAGYGRYTFQDIKNNCNDLLVFYPKNLRLSDNVYNTNYWKVLANGAIYHNVAAAVPNNHSVIWTDKYISQNTTKKNTRIKFKFLPQSSEWELMINLFRKSNSGTIGGSVWNGCVTLNILKETSRQMSWLRVNNLASGSVVSSANIGIIPIGNTEHEIEVLVFSDKKVSLSIDGRAIFVKKSIAGHNDPLYGYIGFSNYDAMTKKSKFYIYDLTTDTF